VAETVSAKEEIQKRIRRLDGLPSMPGALQEIWRAVRSPNCSAGKLAEAVSTDPGLTARVLRMSNSAYYALNRPVSDVRESVVVLGFEVVKSMAIGASVVDAFKFLGEEFDMNRFWRHSVWTAVAAEQVAMASGGLKPEVAFCGGVLHDIGKLALAAALGPDYRRVMGAADPKEDDAVSERKLLGATHSEAGLWLGQKWKFSSDLLDILAYHHTPERAEDSARLVTAVALAEALLPQQGEPCVEEDRAELRPEWLEALGLDASSLDVLKTQIGDRLRAAGPMAAFQS
jgi:HD-like signal output (HDOD) protein